MIKFVIFILKTRRTGEWIWECTYVIGAINQKSVPVLQREMMESQTGIMMVEMEQKCLGTKSDRS